MSSFILNIYNLNNILASRTMKSRMLYFSLVIITTILVSLFIGVPLLTDFVGFDSQEEFKHMVSFSCFIVFFVDALLTILRFRSKTLVEPKFLIIFPISKINKLLMQIIIMTVDIKSIFYICVLVIFFLYVYFQATLVNALFSAVLIILFMIATTLIYLLVYQILPDLLIKYRQHLIGIIFGLIVISNILITTKQYSVFSAIPLIAFLGQGIYALSINDLQQFIFNLFFLSIIILLTFLLLFSISKGK